MPTELLMGNQAIAMGAIRAGVSIVTGYPGTPSTEILETVAQKNPGNIYVEWSVNEKAALEVAAGAAYAGRRCLVTMKQVGLNVASDPLMSLAYIGVKGGLVIVVADDPGPISSQTEQDTRHFAGYAKLPVFDPASPEEAYEMIADAFACSEQYQTPVLFRPTTRVCHGNASVELDSPSNSADSATAAGFAAAAGFAKDARWTIFPQLSYRNHLMIEARLPVMGDAFSDYRFNTLTGRGRKGIVTGGVSHAYTGEALSILQAECRVLRVATPHPFPERLALEFLQDVDEVLAIEELDPVLEDALIHICGSHGLAVRIMGKRTGHIQQAGENTVESVTRAMAGFLGLAAPSAATGPQPANLPGLPAQPAVHGLPAQPAVPGLPAGPAEPAGPELPVRPPVLCAGCPHRASFYAVKQAMKGRKSVFSGDIGCYTLGNAKPLEMVDTCLCMGAGITIAQGLHRAEPDTVNFAFIGDSTFFHSGIPGIVNAIYNGTDIVLVVLDNATTAMTGCQPHPGTGRTMMGAIAGRISIRKVLEALGVEHVVTQNPFDLQNAIAAVRETIAGTGVRAIIFEAPCIAVSKPAPPYQVDRDACTGCRRCLRELGCPAIVKDRDKVRIDASLCYGCSICADVCPVHAFRQENGGGQA